MNLRSIRWQLPLSYAAIALLAAVALGVILLATLRSYYSEREREYLFQNAKIANSMILPLLKARLPESTVGAQLNNLAVITRTRIRLLDSKQAVLIDSGESARQDILTVLPLDSSQTMPVSGQEQQIVIQKGEIMGDGAEDGISVMASGWEGRVVGSVSSAYIYVSPLVTDTITRTLSLSIAGEFSPTLPIKAGYAMVTTLPARDTFYTFEAIGEPLRDQQYSNVSVRIPVQDTSGNTIATLWLSDGPAYGASILFRVALAWGIASLAAVLLAAAAGWAISRRLTAPLLALTDVTQTMAEGDLTVRADTLPEVEFNELARSFNQMASRVEAMVLALRRFVSDASHELQTPLTALRTNLDLAVSELDPAVQKTYLERALGQVERLHQLATGLLDLSRMEAGLNHHEPAPVDLKQMVSELSEVYAAQAEQAGKEFSLFAPEDLVLVLGNEGQLRQAVGNLIDNALKFTPPGGTIVVSLDSSGDQIRVSVEDTGIGVPAGDLDQLFKRFHRGRNAAAYPGSGLGLAIVQTIAEAHRGTVTAENRPTGGAKFTLQLPR